MMRARLLQLAARRAQLVARAQSERESVARLLETTDGAASIATALVRMAQSALSLALRHPLLAGAGLLVFLVLRPRRAIGLLAKGWSLWRLYRGALGWWQRFAAITDAPAGAQINLASSGNR